MVDKKLCFFPKLANFYARVCVCVKLVNLLMFDL